MRGPEINALPRKRHGVSYLATISITYVVPVLGRKSIALQLSTYMMLIRTRLIAILLGRFRMTIQDCIEEYEGLGREVFGKPRILCTMRLGVGNRAKYSASKLEKVFEDVSVRRNEHLSELDRNIHFPSGPGLCKT
jgi:hypothetical protein